MATDQLVVFRLANEEYAIPIGQVKEIIQYKGATKLPNTPKYMDGIISLRGKVISIMDLAGKFGLAIEKKLVRQVLIVETAGQDVGLVVDVVIEVIRLEQSALEVVNDIAQSREYISCVGKVGNRLLIILDLSKLFMQDELTAIRDAG